MLKLKIESKKIAQHLYMYTLYNVHTYVLHNTCCTCCTGTDPVRDVPARILYVLYRHGSCNWASLLIILNYFLKVLKIGRNTIQLLVRKKYSILPIQDSVKYIELTPFYSKDLISVGLIPTAYKYVNISD